MKKRFLVAAFSLLQVVAAYKSEDEFDKIQKPKNNSISLGTEVISREELEKEACHLIEELAYIEIAKHVIEAFLREEDAFRVPESTLTPEELEDRAETRRGIIAHIPEETAHLPEETRLGILDRIVKMNLLPLETRKKLLAITSKMFDLENVPLLYTPDSALLKGLLRREAERMVQVCSLCFSKILKG